MYGVQSSGQFGSLAELGGAPIVIVQDQEQKKRLTGHEAHKSNIMSGVAVAQIVRSSFGPKGMDKIIISPDGDVVVSNDGATILDRIPVEHECARLLVDLSKSQDKEIGDGTTGVTIMAGALLEHALKLLDKKIHPIKIADGYERASQIAIEKVKEIAKIPDLPRKELLLRAARTSLTSKVVSSESELLANICVEAIEKVGNEQRMTANLDTIKVEGKSGGQLGESKLIDGLTIAKSFSHSQMAKEIKDAKIAILTCPFEAPKPKTKHRLAVKSTQAYNELVEQEAKYFTEMAKKVKDSGANVVFCQWGFDDEANHLLLKNNLPSVRWVSGNDIELLSMATGGRIIPRFEYLTEDKLGRAKSVKEISVGTEDSRMILVEGCDGHNVNGDNVNACTILLRCGNAMVLSEAKRCVHDALCAVRNIYQDSRVVAGGGAVEVAASIAVMEAARNCVSSDQHAYEAFAEALTNIPMALAENSGIPAIKMLGEVRSRQIKENNPYIGVDCYAAEAMDMLDNHVYESVTSKINQIALATQVVKMILKIDDIIVPADMF